MVGLCQIPGQPGYFCDAAGGVWSRKQGGPRPLRAFVRDRSGHTAVNLSHGGRYRLHAVHRLIAAAWLGPPPSPGHVVMHADDDPRNNAVSNLSYGLPADNSAQMVSRGRQARGEAAGNSKLKNTDVAEIRRRASAGEKKRAIAQAFGVSPSTVSDISRYKTWRP